MQTEVLSADHPIAIPHALDILQRGGVVAFPTDTVYGLGAMPTSDDNIERLYVIKGRSHTRAIAILIGHFSDLFRVAVNPNKTALRLAQAFWPGPLTLIVPRHPGLSRSLSQTETIGVRVPNHPVAIKLLRQSGPLAVTSANISGGENPQSADNVLEQLQGRFHLLLDGGVTPGGVPSTVVDCTGAKPVILRQGPVTAEQIDQALA